LALLYNQQQFRTELAGKNRARNIKSFLYILCILLYFFPIFGEFQALSILNIFVSVKKNTKEEIKKFVNEKFRTAMWTNHSGCKKAYYIKEFTQNCDHIEKTYLEATIKGKARLLVARLRMGSHHLRCETSRWRIPKEVWEERTCIFYNKGVVETEWHFVMECAAYEDIRS
jgi:hypothetical protein